MTSRIVANKCGQQRSTTRRHICDVHWIIIRIIDVFAARTALRQSVSQSAKTSPVESIRAVRRCSFVPNRNVRWRRSAASERPSELDFCVRYERRSLLSAIGGRAAKLAASPASTYRQSALCVWTNTERKYGNRKLERNANNVGANMTHSRTWTWTRIRYTQKNVYQGRRTKCQPGSGTDNVASVMWYALLNALVCVCECVRL